jgi:hypothetical protein
VKKSAKWSLGSLLVAGAIGAMLLPATAASATEGFACPDATDTIEVPYAFTADNTPELAGVVCVDAGTTVFNSMDVTDGWSAQVKADGTGSKDRTEVRFTDASTGDRVELRYEAGRTEIKN